MMPSFDEFYAFEYRAVVRLAYKLSGTLSVAEDLAQEAFLRAFRDWSTVNAYEHPGAWVRRVTINLAHSRGRRQRGVWRLALEPPEEPWTDPAISHDTRELWALVGRLPRRQAEVLVLYYEVDQSTAQISEILGCAESTVRVHLHRARTQLAAVLDASANEGDVCDGD